MALRFDVREVWGQRRKEGQRRRGDCRPEEERDRSRIIHSAAFRRLQAKTQVLGIEQGDFHRTRLTHTMEVAQIGRGIVLQLRNNGRCDEIADVLPKPAQIEAMCFAHDLGHPPFGHSGEIALNYSMRDHDGFEGNGHSLRIVSCLEPHSPGFGLNLTRRNLLGILKYPAPYSQLTRKKAVPIPYRFPTRDWAPPKCYLDGESDVVDWVLQGLSKGDRSRFCEVGTRPTEEEHGRTKYKSLDCAILELADDIAYGVHDLEDAIALRLIDRDSFSEKIKREDLTWAREYDFDFEGLIEGLFGETSRDGSRKLAVNSLVNALLACIEIHRIDEFESPILRYGVALPSEPRDFLRAVHDLIRERVFKSQEVQTLEFRGRKIVLDLFDALISDPTSLLGETARKRLVKREDEHRLVCDYVAGMTDAFAVRFHERLFGPRQASVFERL
jgi:dGTPase